MEWTLRKRMWAVLAVAVVLVVVLVRLSGRQPVARVAMVRAVRENLNAIVSSNGKVEPITPYAIRAQFPALESGLYIIALTAK